MWIMIENDDYYWETGMGEKPYYMTVYQDPVFESFNTTEKREVRSEEKLFRIKVRVF